MQPRDKRLSDLEFDLGTMGRTLEQLDEDVIEHGKTLASLQRPVRGLDSRVRALEARLGDGADSAPALAPDDSPEL